MRNTRVYPSFLGSTSSRATNARTVAVTGCSVARESAIHRVGQAMALACIANLLSSLSFSFLSPALVAHTNSASGGSYASCYGYRGRGIQRRKLPVHGSLCQRQTPGTGGFPDLQRVAKGVRDLRWTVGEPFLKGANEQYLMDTTILTSHDTCEHTRSPLGYRQHHSKHLRFFLAHVPGAALCLSAGCPREVPSPQRSLRRAAFVTLGGRPAALSPLARRQNPCQPVAFFLRDVFSRGCSAHAAWPGVPLPATEGDRRHTVVVGRM